MKKIILDFAKAVCEGEQTMIDEKKVDFISTLILALTNRITSVKSISRKKTMVFQRTGGVSRVLQSSVW